MGSFYICMRRFKIEIVEKGDMKGEVYPFGIVGMANKGDCLQKGESVKFQLCVMGQNAQTMAYNITLLRRATVECVKGQFGFINYEVADNKKLFFHVKEIQDGIELQAGDEVEFSVILNQRTGKCSSACNVWQVCEGPKAVAAPRPDRLVNRLKNITLDDASAPRLMVLCQPKTFQNIFITPRENPIAIKQSLPILPSSVTTNLPSVTVPPPVLESYCV
ncbi:cold shock domain-containing protein E1-like [Nycticebus coucang]|uniref:cold shock domain-containing protein E1-like n=1 Tax=Nycticebus coucang TaxID=9470 RepID=UPI00234D0179|nr:cold shock domain-containing protein E1-like [Nycticebus coucang]